MPPRTAACRAPPRAPASASAPPAASTTGHRAGSAKWRRARRAATTCDVAGPAGPVPPEPTGGLTWRSASIRVVEITDEATCATERPCSANDGLVGRVGILLDCDD